MVGAGELGAQSLQLHADVATLAAALKLDGLVVEAVLVLDTHLVVVVMEDVMVVDVVVMEEQDHTLLEVVEVLV